MKNRLVRSFAAVTLVSAAAAGHAQSTDPALYGEIGYSAVSVSIKDGTDSTRFRPDLLTGVIGYRLNPNLSVEGLLGFGVGDSGVKFNGSSVPAKGELGTSYGVFLRPSVPVSESVELFGRVGFVRSAVKLSADGLSVSDSDTGVAYGVGANFHLGKSSYLQANWTSYYNRGRTKIDGIGLAWGLKF